MLPEKTLENSTFKDRKFNCRLTLANTKLTHVSVLKMPLLASAAMI